MTSLRKELMAGTAGLLLSFSAAANAGLPARLPERIPEASAPITTVLQNYNTAATLRLKKMEDSFAQDRPARTPRVVLLDYDQISAWFMDDAGPDGFDKAIGDYLAAKTGRPYDQQALDRLAQAMDTLTPMSLIRNPAMPGKARPPAENGQCLVVPQYPGISFSTFYAQSFLTGRGGANPLAEQSPRIGLSTQDFGDFATRHEIWHCLDTRYAPQSQFSDDFDRIMVTHKAEVFADLGGVAEGIRQGANLTLIDKIAAMRATWVWLTGPARAHSQTAENDDAYKSVIYNTQPALALLKDRIQAMGLTQFRKLDRGALRDLLYDVTEKAALTPETARALTAYYRDGKTSSTALQPLLRDMQAITAKTLRGPGVSPAFQTAAGTPDEESRRQVATNAAIRARADDGNVPALLRAKAALTDETRQRLDQDSPAPVERDLTTLFYTNLQRNP